MPRGVFMNQGKEQVDIEQYSKSEKKIPESDVSYLLRIDGHKHEVLTATVTGQQLLDLAGHMGKHHEFDLYQKFTAGKREKIEPGSIVDLTTPGIEKFITICKTNTDGLHNRRDFELPENDLNFLKSRDYHWETISGSGQKFLIIHCYPIPAGYNVNNASLALLIAAGFPETQIDMGFFKPALKRTAGIAIRAISQENVVGEFWQRWSRHRTAENKWRPGVDDLSTHLAYVDNWLEAELKRGQ